MGKFFRKIKDKFGEIGTGIKSRIFSAENQSVQEPSNSSNNKESTNKNQITPDEPHSKSPSLNSDLSINDKNENVKILKLFLVFWLVFGRLY